MSGYIRNLLLQKVVPDSDKFYIYSISHYTYINIVTTIATWTFLPFVFINDQYCSDILVLLVIIY